MAGEAWVEVLDSLTSRDRRSPLDLGEVRVTGLYAWWDPSGGVPFPTGFPPVDQSRPLYIGLAKKGTLAARGLGMHLKTTRMSTLRRSLSALLRDELDLLADVRPAAAGKYGLAQPSEDRLTAWILDHLQVTWVEHPAPQLVERDVVRAEAPPLNYDFATAGPYAKPLQLIRAQLRSDAS